MTYIVLVFGILGMTDEYRHGTITYTYLATPRRGRVIVVKLVVYARRRRPGHAALALLRRQLIGVVGLPMRGVSYQTPDGAALADYARQIGTAGLITAFGVALGALLRAQVVTVAGTLIWALLVEPLIVAFKPQMGTWLPFNVFSQVISSADRQRCRRRRPLDGLSTARGVPGELRLHRRRQRPRPSSSRCAATSPRGDWRSSGLRRSRRPGAGGGALGAAPPSSGSGRRRREHARGELLVELVQAAGCSPAIVNFCTMSLALSSSSTCSAMNHCRKLYVAWSLSSRASEASSKMRCVTPSSCASASLNIARPSGHSPAGLAIASSFTRPPRWVDVVEHLLRVRQLLLVLHGHPVLAARHARSRRTAPPWRGTDTRSRTPS